MPTSERFPPGTRVAGTIYQIVGKLAEGGMGAVYEVEDITIGKRYVLKTLLPSLEARDVLARRMSNEARVLARLAHPNIVDVITAGVTADEAGVPFFVMERLTGRSLAAVLARHGRLELEIACRIAIDVLDALGHAHDNGIVHRDVKPDNIFIHRASAQHTVTKLLDFGIMHFAGSNERPSSLFGTLRYVTPEAVQRLPATAATDLFTVGLVLYEMLAGRGPWDDHIDAQDRAHAHATAVAPALSESGITVPERLERLIASALDKDPAGRPRDAATFANELRALIEAPSHEPEPNELSALALRENDEAEGLQEVAQTLIDFESFTLSPSRDTVADVAPLVPRRMPLSTTAPTVVEPSELPHSPPSTVPRANRSHRVLVVAAVLCGVLTGITLWLRRTSAPESPPPTAELPNMPSAATSNVVTTANPAVARDTDRSLPDASAPAPRAPAVRASGRARQRAVPGVDF